MSAVKTKLDRREFKIFSPINLSDDEKNSLIKKVYNNRNKRLKIKQHDKNTLKNDEFVIQADENLI